jgi:hypothetical protein
MVTSRGHSILGLLVQQPSTNFAFLVNHSASLARLGALAEWAFHHDPPTTLGKLRLFAELLAKLIAARHAVEIVPGQSFDTVLRLLRDQGLAPSTDRAFPLPAAGWECRRPR